MRTNLTLLILVATVALTGCSQKRAPVLTGQTPPSTTTTGQGTANTDPQLIPEATPDPNPEQSKKAPAVTNPDQAQMAVNEVQLLTEVAFEKIINRQELTAEDKSKLQKALPIVDQLIAYDPLSRAFASIKGKALIGLGQYKKAETFLQNAILVKPKNGQDIEIMIYAGLEADLSRALLEQGELETAFEHIQTARIALPQDPYFMTDASYILIKLGNLKDARTICQRALKVDPGHLPAHQLIEQIDKTTQS